MRRELHGGRIVRVPTKRPSNVYQMFRGAVECAPDAIALKEGDRALSYQELDLLVEQAALGATGLGIGRGARVGVLMINSVMNVVVLLALARIGACSVPMNTRQVSSETAFMLSNSDAAFFIYDGALADKLPQVTDLPGVIFVKAQDLSLMRSASQLPPGPGEDDLFCIIHTSGSTGRPKGAMLTHLGVIVSSMQYRDAFSLTSDDSIVLAVPVSHVTGLVAVLFTMLGVGGRTVIMGEFKARDYIELAAKEATSYAFMVPAMYTLCMMQGTLSAADLSSWRVAAYGGAPMPEATISALRQAVPSLELYNVYGASEVTSPATILPASQAERYPDSCGLALPSVDLLIVDDEDVEVPSGQVGEILIAGSTVSPGYWNDIDATSAAFVGGYWRSGDMGSLDDQRFLRVSGRRKEMINRGGYKIYPAEVENALSLFPGVLEAAVFGLPDSVLGECVHAYVVVGADAPQADDIRAHCAAWLSDYKVPSSIVISTEPVPRMANGKPDKARLRARLVAELVNDRPIR